MVEKRTATSKVTAMRGAKKRRRTAKHNGDVVGTSEDSQDSNLDDDDDNHHSNDDGGASLDAAETSTVACQNCRKRKSKCSKTQPCFQCVKLNVSCLYTDRGRPGMKIGAVEALANRLSNLEQMFLGQGLLFQSYLLGDQGQQSSGASSLAAQSSRLRETYLGSARAALKPARSPSTTRIANTDVATPDVSGISSRPTTVAIPQRTRLPPPQIVDGVVEWYFAQVHRWIPILDRQQFEENLRRQYNSRTSNIVLLAMLSIGLRLWQDPAADPYRAASAEHRSAVLLSGMESVSIETLQALAIVAFDIIGSGHGPSAWSVIGSMARTVEQIRLNAEEEASDADRSELPANEVLLRRIRFLRPSQNWVEEEERRRLFWSIFMMDRFCSVTTGWSNSLSILHCRRRLPCEGSLWRLRTLVHTPFFGDGVKAQFLSRDSSPRPPGSPQEGAHHQHNATSSEQDSSTDSIGGFAYCIEATETLNLVTKFLLQHSLAFKEQKEAQRWLMRFRDLDLRLIK
nr:c6 transcription [Melanopsichium pennsylvanicum 4]